VQENRNLPLEALSRAAEQLASDASVTHCIISQFQFLETLHRRQSPGRDGCLYAHAWGVAREGRRVHGWELCARRAMASLGHEKRRPPRGRGQQRSWKLFLGSSPL